MPTAMVKNINIYYEVQGEGEPLILVGGMSIGISEYGSLIQGLSQKYKVIAFDKRGSGRTDKPDIPDSIDMLAEDTEGLLETLGAAPVHVMGISMGRRIATALTLAYPDRVKSLILISTCVKPVPRNWSVHPLGIMLIIPVWRKMGKPYQSSPRRSFAHTRGRPDGRTRWLPRPQETARARQVALALLFLDEGRFLLSLAR